MMTLKPYISLQKRPYTYNGNEDEILYVGISVLVPDGFVLYLRHPSTPDPNEDISICNITLELFRASTNRHTSSQDFLLGLDKKQWPNLESVKVEVMYIETENAQHQELQNPNRPIGQDNLKCVGMAKMKAEDAGNLLLENGFNLTNEDPQTLQSSLPIEDNLKKIQNLIPRAVGPKDPDNRNRPNGGGA